MSAKRSTTGSTVVTARLELLPASMRELDEVARLHADERVWQHRPSGRHTSVEQTRGKVVEMERQWAHDGLGYWTARLRQSVAALPAGAFAGVGGCAIGAGGSWWNLYYRLRPELHGHGLAGELCQAALTAARSADRALPIVAYLVEHNYASRRTAERAGLQLQWRGPEAGDQDVVRLIYADRRLDAEQLSAVIVHA